MLSLLFTASNVFAETVTLKSGKVIEGEIIERNDEYIKVKSGDKEIYYELKYVQSIREDKAAIPQEEAEFKPAVDYLKEGLRYGAEAKFQEAEKAFQKGLKVNSSDHNLQEVLRLIGDLRKGLISEAYTIYLFKGSDYLINGQYKEAIREFKEALKLAPEDADLNYYLGICSYSLEEYQDAISYLRKSQEKKPSDAEISYYLGASYYSLGEYEDAINYLKKLLILTRDDPEAYAILGASYYSQGNNEQAKENLIRAQQLFQKAGDYLKASDIEEFLKGIN